MLLRGESFDRVTGDAASSIDFFPRCRLLKRPRGGFRKLLASRASSKGGSCYFGVLDVGRLGF